MKKRREDRWAEGRANAKALMEAFEASPLHDWAVSEVTAEQAAAAAMARARERAKLTQAQVAERMGSTQGNVSRALRGRVTVETLARYLAACGFAMDIRLRPLR